MRNDTGREGIKGRKMKKSVSKWLEIFIISVNYSIISYALSNMTMLFRHSLLYILFFASEIWVTGDYWSRVYKLTENKLISILLIIVCFLVQMGMVYSVRLF